MADTAQGLADEDLRFIAETREQVGELYDAFRAGKLPVGPELLTALSQIRTELLAIKIDGSIDGAAADQRIAACVQIAQMARDAQPQPSPTTATQPVDTPAMSPSAGRQQTDLIAQALPSALIAPEDTALSDPTPTPPPPPFNYLAISTSGPSQTVDPPAPPMASGPEWQWTTDPPEHPLLGQPPLQPYGMPPVQARRRRLPVVLSAIFAAVALIAGSVVYWNNRSSGPLIARVSAAKALQMSLAAASRAGSVHLAKDNTVGTDDGVGQSIDMTASWDLVTSYLPQGETEIIVDGSTVYVNGDKYGLAQLGFPASTATSYSSKWMTVPPGDQQIAQPLRTPALISDVLALTGPVKRVGKIVNHQLTVSGRIPSNQFTGGLGAGDPATLVLSTQSPYYPVSLRYQDPKSGPISLLFQRWGQVVSWVPRGAVPMPSLQGAPVAPSTPTVEAPITDTVDPPFPSVTPDEARMVALSLWNENSQARTDRDIAGLQMLDAQPELAADLGYICQWGCRGPELQSSQVMVTVPRETSWPAYFFATVPYTTNCEADSSPCDDTFVAVQAAPHAEWQITVLVGWSGHAYVASAPVPDGQYSPPPSPAPGTHLDTLPKEYASYLQAIKDSGQPPATTRLAAGPFTTDLIATNYAPLSQQESEGAVHHVTYSVSPSDKVWEFPGSQGTTAVCGTVRFTDIVSPTPGHVLTQSDSDHPYGNLAVGTYSSVSLAGLHMVCFEAYPDPAKPVAVLGTWGDLTNAKGTAIAVETNPT